MKTLQSIAHIAILTLALLALTSCMSPVSTTPKLPATTTLSEIKVNDSPKQSDLSLSIETDKNIYQISESIFVTVKLINISDQTIIVKNRMLSGYTWDDKRQYDRICDVRYYIYSPSGVDIRSGVLYEAPLLNAKHFIPLAPRENIQRNFDLIGGIEYADSLFEEIGIYTIYLVYYNYFDPSESLHAWKGELQSNIIHFEIKP